MQYSGLRDLVLILTLWVCICCWIDPGFRSRRFKGNWTRFVDSSVRNRTLAFCRGRRHCKGVLRTQRSSWPFYVHFEVERGLAELLPCDDLIRVQRSEKLLVASLGVEDQHSQQGQVLDLLADDESDEKLLLSLSCEAVLSVRVYAVRHCRAPILVVVAAAVALMQCSQPEKFAVVLLCSQLVVWAHQQKPTTMAAVAVLIFLRNAAHQPQQPVVVVVVSVLW